MFDLGNYDNGRYHWSYVSCKILLIYFFYDFLQILVVQNLAVVVGYMFLSTCAIEMLLNFQINHVFL